MIDDFCDIKEIEQSYCIDNDFIILEEPDMGKLGKRVKEKAFNLVLLCTCGECVISTLMNNVAISSQEVIFFSSNRFFELVSISENFTSIALLLSDSFLSGMDIKRQIGFMEHSGHVFRSSSHGSFEKFINISKDIIRVDTHPEKKEVISLLTKAYLVGLSHFWEKEAIQFITSNASSEIAKRFLVLLQSDIKCVRNVKNYAERLNISEKHLYYALKQSTGHGTNYWINRRVIHDAKYLLSVCKMSVLDTSIRLGFQSQSAFGRYFKNQTGITPRDYINH